VESRAERATEQNSGGAAARYDGRKSERSERFHHNVHEYAKPRHCYRYELPLSDDCILLVLALNFKKCGLGERNSDTFENKSKSSLFLEPHIHCYRM
jgi:hypothetical protein